MFDCRKGTAFIVFRYFIRYHYAFLNHGKQLLITINVPRFLTIFFYNYVDLFVYVIIIYHLVRSYYTGHLCDVYIMQAFIIYIFQRKSIRRIEKKKEGQISFSPNTLLTL